MLLLVNGTPERVLHQGKNMVVVLDESVEGNKKVIYTQDVKCVEKVSNKRVYGRLVTQANTPKKTRRKRMSNADKLFSNTPVAMN